MNAFIRFVSCQLLLMSLGATVSLATIGVTTHSADGILVPGFNRLAGGDEFLVPAAGTGSRYLIVNETGQTVRLVPGQATLAIGNLPPGHQGTVNAAMKLDLLETGSDGFYLWQGTVADGGDYYLDSTPTVVLNPGSASFGEVTIGGSADLTLTLSNGGSADLLLGALGQNNPLAVPFSLPAPADGCSNQALAPGASCTAVVRFAPETGGTLSDSFDIPSNDPDSPVVTVAVSGTGMSLTVVNGTDFSEAGLGSGIPVGWTERWETGSTTYTVMESLDVAGSNELNAYADTGARRLLSFDGADSLGADVDQLMLFKDPVNEGSIHTDFRLYARASGGPGTESAYYFTTNNNQQQVNIYKYVNGVVTPLVGEQEEIGFNATDAWWVRLRTEGNALHARIWPFGSVEPRDWLLTATDTSIPAGGWQGIGNYWVGDHIFREYAVAALPAAAEPVNGFGITALSAPVINLDAESGDTRGWVNEFGDLRVNRSTTLARSGEVHFMGSGQNFRAYQRIDLAASGVTAATLAQGVTVSFRAWQRSLSYGDDPGRIGLRILDANGNELETSFTDWDYKNTTYVPKAVIRRLPDAAAFVDIILEGQLVRGTAASSYFDDLEVGIAVQ